MQDQDSSAVNQTLNVSHAHSLPLIFQHPELLTDIKSLKHWDKNKLINKLNYINFTDGHIFALFRHRIDGHDIMVKAFPWPCTKDTLICSLDKSVNLFKLAEYNFNNLIIDEGLLVILVPAIFIAIERETITLGLPEQSSVIAKRQVRRHLCKGIDCEVIQNEYIAQGSLIDFTPRAFGAILIPVDNELSLDEKSDALVNLARNGLKLYSGLCRLIRNNMKSRNGKIVFAPTNNPINLFPKRELRNPRQHIVPSFSVSFNHPFFQKIVQRDIIDISTSGFAIKDNMDEETLLPGMIIPEMTIIYAGFVKMNCSAQVIYRQVNPDDNTVQCGFAIADMDIQSYSSLNHILGTYLDHNARVSTKVDMDALWEFFFDTGFIYGEKYEHLEPNRELFKETYRKLYQDNPDIARHFVYEKNGKIYGHNAIIHAYNSSWIIHHLAARPMESRIPGLMLIKQTTNYINGVYRFNSAEMDYVMAYYRPENRIMDKVFGGFTKYLDIPKGSSLDLFSYIHFQKNPLDNVLLPGWILRECIPSDFDKLSDFYEKRSGGLLLKAIELDSSINPLREVYAKAGFKRNCQTFCLCHEGKQSAFFITNQSDLGLNLSDLLNGIKIIITNEAEAKWDIIASAVNKIGYLYEENNIPLLIYPHDYLSSQNIETTKYYKLWILKNNPYSEKYTEYMGKYFRMRYSAD
jgi:hypothetical protein